MGDGGGLYVCGEDGDRGAEDGTDVVEDVSDVGVGSEVGGVEVSDVVEGVVLSVVGVVEMMIGSGDGVVESVVVIDVESELGVVDSMVVVVVKSGVVVVICGVIIIVTIEVSVSWSTATFDGAHTSTWPGFIFARW